MDMQDLGKSRLENGLIFPPIHLELIVTDHFILVTNAVLLRKAREAVWRAIDEIEVSLYPGVHQTKENILFAKEKADALGKN
ncbi:MAG: hypothetical protein FP816_06685 [Desulfobacteraceae bacterium]|nr:hypothetical protein [Desulfobacteraceae bacterium]